MGDAPERFLGSVAIQLACAVIPIGNPVRRVTDKDRVKAQVEQPSLFGHRSLHPFALGHIPRHFGRPDDMPCGIPYRRNCKRNIERRAVFAHTNRLEMIDALPSPEPLKNHGFLVLAIAWNYERNMLADGFFSLVAE